MITNEEIVKQLKKLLPKWIILLYKCRCGWLIPSKLVGQRDLRVIGLNRREWLYRNKVILTEQNDSLIDGDAPFKGLEKWPSNKGLKIWPSKL